MEQWLGGPSGSFHASYLTLQDLFPGVSRYIMPFPVGCASIYRNGLLRSGGRHPKNPSQGATVASLAGGHFPGRRRLTCQCLSLVVNIVIVIVFNRRDFDSGFGG